MKQLRNSISMQNACFFSEVTYELWTQLYMLMILSANLKRLSVALAGGPHDQVTPITGIYPLLLSHWKCKLFGCLYYKLTTRPWLNPHTTDITILLYQLYGVVKYYSTGSTHQMSVWKACMICLSRQK